ncbi:MAG: FHA domain-containing protein [Xenococcus sp. (in: cyanobacteria)]
MPNIDELEVTTARSEAQMLEISEAFPSEAIFEPAEEELVEVTEFDPDSNSEQDMFEPDLDMDIAAALPEMPDIDELEVTNVKTASEISENAEPELVEELEITNAELDMAAGIPELAEPEPVEELEITNAELDIAPEIPENAEPEPVEELEITNAELDIAPEIPENAEPEPVEELEITNAELDIAPEIPELAEPEPAVTAKKPAFSNPRSLSQPIKPISESATQLQLERVILSHVQTGTDIELAQNLDIIRIGKPNSQIPPDIDVSDLPDASIVSRIHANIRVEGDNYFIEDAGSSNGTYINHKPLLIGNRHRLRFGDRISLGKGDLMTFIFKIIQE